MTKSKIPGFCWDPVLFIGALDHTCGTGKVILGQVLAWMIWPDADNVRFPTITATSTTKMNYQNEKKMSVGQLIWLQVPKSYIHYELLSGYVEIAHDFIYLDHESLILISQNIRFLIMRNKSVNHVIISNTVTNLFMLLSWCPVC